MPRLLLAGLPARVEARVETPKGSFLKRSSRGSVDFVSPVPCPFNYGSVCGRMAADGEPLDAVILGPKRARLQLVWMSVLGVVGFLDAGIEDHKIILGQDEGLHGGTIAQLERFFCRYCRVKNLVGGMRGAEPTRFLGVEVFEAGGSHLVMKRGVGWGAS